MGLLTATANAYTKTQSVTPSSVTYAASVTLDLASRSIFTVTLTGNLTLAFSNITAGSGGYIVITQDATGSRTLTITGLGTTVKTPGGTAPILTTAANSVDVLSYFCPSGSLVYVNVVKDFK